MKTTGISLAPTLSLEGRVATLGPKGRSKTGEGVMVFVTPLLVALLATPAQAATTYPLTIDNCGQTVTFSAPPQRVVTIKSTATELLLSLGLGDRIVGTAFQDGPLPPDLALAGSGLPILSDKLPSQEVVLEVEPDFIYGGWESSFAADGAGERPTLEALGVATYVAPAACRSVKPAKLTFDQLFNEIAELGIIFDAALDAEMLVEGQQAMLDRVEPDTRGLTALWYSSGTKTPYVGAGSNAPGMIMEALGLTNIFADVDEGWTSASWEAIVDANPDVIILVDAAWNSAEQKMTLLAENPITSQLDAVINRRYLTVPFPAAEAGVRNVPATSDMAFQLARLAFGE
jgi:iron complex transport system substrate-binding protein